MNLRWSKAHALLAGIALIIATNAVALLGVVYNRSGEPESALPLTERELTLVSWDWLYNDNSSIDMRLFWRSRPLPVTANDLEQTESRYDWRGNLYWLTLDDLRAFGFDVTKPLDSEEGQRYYERVLPRPAFFALEFDGPAYQTALANAQIRLKHEADLAAANPGKKEFEERLQRVQKALDLERRSVSRLYIVDAGSDAAVLRARYADRSRYAIVRGQVHIQLVGPEHERQITANVADVDVVRMAVPHEYREVIAPLLRASREGGDHERLPRYQATVKFGQRMEPWIADLKLIDATPR